MNATGRSRETPSSVALWVAAGIAVPFDVDRRLRAGGLALEVGCGGGLGCLALAEAYPSARVVGHDLDAEAIARARSLARAAGLDARVTFAVTDSERLPRAAFELATLQALSECTRAFAILNAVRNALVPEGVGVLVERQPPVALATPPPRVTVNTLRSIAARAGFSRFNPLCRDGGVDVYELRR